MSGVRRVLVTRAAEDCAPLDALLRERGLAPVLLPCIAFEDVAFELPSGMDLVVVASPHAARRLLAQGPDFGQAQFAAVGAATAQALAALGKPCVLAPDEGAGSDAILRKLRPLVRGKRVLLPRAEGGNPALAAELEAAGATVLVRTLYRTVTAPAADPAVLQELREGRIDAIALASGSAARGFVALAGAPAAGRALVICMGRHCADEARKAGLAVAAESGGGLAELADAVARALSSG